MSLSIRAKVKSDKPAYKEKKKTDKGYVWVYDEKHVEKRWKEKREKLKKLEKELDKVRKQYKEDLSSDDDRTRAIAAIVGIMDNTAMRIGNEESAREGTFGASTLKVKHVKSKGNKITFDFPGKGAIEQNVELTDSKVIKVVKDLMKDKKSDDFIFEIDGSKIWDRAVNRYLQSFDISAKDLRGFHANRLMKEMLKKKDFKEALKEVSEIVGHEASTLKNQYLDPELVEKHEKKKEARLSVRAEDLPVGESRPIESDPEDPSSIDVQMKAQQVDINRNVNNVYKNATLTPSIMNAWRIVAPFMPPGTYLSSAFRGPHEQAEYIIEYWRSYTGFLNTPNKWQRNKGLYRTKFSKELGITDQELNKLYWKAKNKYPYSKNDINLLNNMVYYMTKKSPEGAVPPNLAYVGKSYHQQSMAFDITGSNPNVIRNTLMDVVNMFPSSLQLKSKPLIEPGNRAVHVVLAKSVTMPPTNEFINNLYNYHTKKQPMVKRQSLSIRAELKPEHRDWVRTLKQQLSVAPPVEERELSIRQKQFKPSAVTEGIQSGVKTNELIENAWKTLKPFLPSSAVMTSGARTDKDQLRILNNYWRRSTGQDIPRKYHNDLRALKHVSRLLKKHKGLIVGPPYVRPKYGHLSGNAFDISGANLDQIAKAVRFVTQNSELPVNFRSPLIERANNAVHVGVESAQYDPQAVAKVKQQLGGVRSASGDNDDRIISAIYNDLLVSDASSSIINEFEDIFKLGYSNTIPDYAADLELNDEDMGFGIPDDMGDWFEKAPIFRFREENAGEHDIQDVGDKEARQIAENDPDDYFYRGLHKDFPEHEALALKNMIKDNAKFYFVFKYHEDEEEKFKNLLEDAAEALSQQDARAFFYYHLHHKFPELGRGAIIQLIDINPDSFFDLGLDKDYPDYIESANNARNIKDPNKMELEMPEWAESIVEKKSLSVRDGLNKSSKKSKKQSAGVFALLPKSLSKQFPSLGEHDDSAPHVTVLYIGEVPKEKQKVVKGMVKQVLENYEPFELKLDSKVSYFPATKHSDGCKVAKMAVKSKELHKLNKELKKALKDADVEIDDHFPTYKPHVTLEYMEPPKDKYDSKIPSGSWTVNHLEIWNCGEEKERIPLKKNKKALSKRAGSLGPIAPMKLRTVDNPQELLEDYDDEDFVIQQKYDGWKVMAIKDQSGVKLYTRKGKDFTSNTPSLVKDLEDKLDEGDFVLGELIWVKGDKQSISDVQTIAGSSSEKAQKHMEDTEGQLVFKVYDLLWDNNKDITKTPYEERYNKLKKQIGKGTDHIELVENHKWSELDDVVAEALKKGGEGAVIKTKSGEYKYGPEGATEKAGDQWKYKTKKKEEDVIVKDYTIGEGGKLIMPAYQYDGEKLVDVGKVSGLPKEEADWVKKELDKGKKVVLEIAYQEKFKDTGKIRGPGYRRIRKDKAPKDVKMSCRDYLMRI